MVDETTDISNKEQVVLCFRWIDKYLEAHEEFIGLYLVGSTAASVLFSVIKDVFARMNIDIKKLRVQCYDGAYCKKSQSSLYSLLIKFSLF